MISVCIPVFNRNVNRLVDDLVQQIEKGGLDAEIILLDDGSTEEIRRQNDSLRDKKYVIYLPLIENIGTSRIRNRIADLASGDWLLFLDCDVTIMNQDFLRTYEQCTRGVNDVFYGDVYYGNKPTHRNEQLQWRTQQLALRHRARLSRRGLYEYISTGNFLIRRTLFESIHFDEKLTTYGQEDQIFSIELKKKGTTPIKIDNPVKHEDRTINSSFVDKIEDSLINLVRIWRADEEFRPQLERASHRLRTARRLRPLGLTALFQLFFVFLGRTIRSACIHSKLPTWCFSFYQMIFLMVAFRAPNVEAFGEKHKGSVKGVAV